MQKTAIITGGGTGIGLATSRHLLSQGWRVIAGGIDHEEDLPEGLDFLQTDVTRAADETASKPDPLMLNQILAHCDMRPEQALMVGDASFDLLMARNAGIDSVAVSYGAQSIERLRDFDPVLEVDHFPELRGWLEARAHSRLC